MKVGGAENTLAVFDGVVSAGERVDCSWDFAVGMGLMGLPCYEVDQVDEDGPLHLLRRQASLSSVVAAFENVYKTTSTGSS